MKKISVTKAQNNFSELISTVEQGEDIHLTQHGKPVAVLISEERYQQLLGNDKQVFNAIMQWRDQYQATGLIHSLEGEDRLQSTTEYTQNIIELLSMSEDDEIDFIPPKLSL